jgi:hypothetical protein
MCDRILWQHTFGDSAREEEAIIDYHGWWQRRFVKDWSKENHRGTSRRPSRWCMPIVWGAKGLRASGVADVLLKLQERLAWCHDSSQGDCVHDKDEKVATDKFNILGLDVTNAIDGVVSASLNNKFASASENIEKFGKKSRNSLFI